MSINLLPWRQEARHAYRKKCLWILFGVTISFILFFSGLHVFFNQKILHLTTEITLLKNKIARIPLQSIQNNDRLLNKLILLQSAQKTANQKIRDLKNYLRIIANDLPKTATLSVLVLSDQEKTVKGVCATLPDVHRYTEALQNDLTTKNIALSEANHIASDTAFFNFSIRVSP